MTWNCPQCYRANGDRHNTCQGCGDPRPGAADSPQTGTQQHTASTPHPQHPKPQPAPAGPQSTPRAEAGAWFERLARWLQGHTEVSGEVLAVAEAQVPKPTDGFKALSLVMILPVVGIFALPFVIAIVVGSVVLSAALSFLGFGRGGGGGGHGFSPFLLHLMLLRGFTRGENLVPRLGIRLRDAAGQSLDVVALGHVEWPAPATGDELAIVGINRSGVVHIRDGVNQSTGARLKVKGTNWRVVFFGLVALFVVLFIAFGTQQIPAPGGTL